MDFIIVIMGFFFIKVCQFATTNFISQLNQISPNVDAMVYLPV